MLKHFEVEGLNGAIDLEIDFHPDINILTGRNGSGKTTILKLLWYLLSANIERIPREMTFRRIQLITDTTRVDIVAATSPRSRRFRFSYTVHNEKHEQLVTLDEIASEVDFVRIANHALAEGPPTIFFPTFRRLEGGFSLSGSTGREARDRSANPFDADVYLGGDPGIQIKRYLDALSSKLSIGQHRFVASVSTEDVVSLLTTHYANISEQTNKLQDQLNKSIFAVIGGYRIQYPESDAADLAEAKRTLDTISNAVADVSDKTAAFLKPFTVLSDLIGRIFESRGIRITENIVLGSTNRVVKSADLSAGEKQMLSFLCYNAFNQNSPIFIDEPELSLHVDWQRTLIPILLSQQTGNQFIAATHSPFIYSKFPEKEISVGEKAD